MSTIYLPAEENVAAIKATPANRKVLRSHAREALKAYSGLMTWLLLDDDGAVTELYEPQGQTIYVGPLVILATTGDAYKAHGQGAARDQDGNVFRTQRDFLRYFLGEEHFDRIFG